MARTIVLQLRPSVVVHTAGLSSCDPADTNPSALAATASTWLEPVASFTSCARTQKLRFGDHHTSATQLPPGATSLPTMMYPTGPAAVATAATPARSSVMEPGPVVNCQVVPLAEVATYGPGAPTASQPSGPWVTPVSSLSPVPAGTEASVVARAQELPEPFSHTAGYPSALPTATCCAPATASPLTVSSGITPPGIPASEIGRTVPAVFASTSIACWPILLAAVYPTATMVPAGATVAPTTDSSAASPSGPVGCQLAPSPLLV